MLEKNEKNMELVKTYPHIYNRARIGHGGSGCSGGLLQSWRMWSCWRSGGGGGWLQQLQVQLLETASKRKPLLPCLLASRSLLLPPLTLSFKPTFNLRSKTQNYLIKNTNTLETRFHDVAPGGESLWLPCNERS